MVMPRSFSSGAASISVVGLGLGEALLGQDGGDGGGKSGLAVVNVADRADVNVRFFLLNFSLAI